MKTSEAQWAYPVTGFTTDHYMWSFRNFDELSTCGPDTLKDHLQDGMELIDAAGRAWRVRSIRRVGGVGLSLGLKCFFARVSRIEHDLERLPDASLADFKRKVQDCVRAQRDVYVWEDETLEQKLEEVARFGNFADLDAAYGLDHFRAY